MDNIIQHSLVLENAYSNGIKSIEALPAITSSIPTLMNNPFITSRYATNNFTSLVHLLKKEGYSSSFFHGGTRGTMGFLQFSKIAGFEKYFGMEDYKNEDHYDGTWGIYDDKFFEYYSKYLDKENEPFISSLFSLSSHPPYSIPSDFKNKFPEGTMKIHETIGYTDFVLKKFFERAQLENWYKNTLFIITSDHTSPTTKNSNYRNLIGRYSIPMIYFMGDTSLKGSNKNITQQIDIMPTTLDILNYNKKFFSFGKSIFNNENWAISFLGDKYLLITKDGFMIDKNEITTNYSDKNLKNKIEVHKESENLLNAIKQKYNNSLIDNKMIANED